jgi:hypothetical protein
MTLLACVFACGLVRSVSGDCELTANLVGDNLDLSTGITTNLSDVSVAYNSTDGEYLVVWFDSRISGQNDVYAQRVSAAGQLLGGNTTIISGSSSQTTTSVAYSPTDNRYLVTWKNQSGPPGSPGFNHTFNRVVSAAGSPLTREVDVSSGGLEATLAYNHADNEYFLEARNFAGGGSAGIYARRISSSGGALGGNIIISTTGAPAPAGQVAYNGNASQFLATWRNQSASDLRGRIINADGSLPGSEFPISSVFPTSGLAASVAFDPVNDRYLVVFGTFSGGPVLGQFVTPSGSLDGPPLTLVVSVNTLNPFVAYDGVNGVFLLAWRDGGSISGHLLSDQGAMLGSSVAIVSDTAVGGPRIAADSSAGGFIVAWTDSRNVPDGHKDTFAQLVGVGIDWPCPGDADCDGEVGVLDFLALLAAWGPQAGPHPADFDGDGEVGVIDFLAQLANWGACP